MRGGEGWGGVVDHFVLMFSFRILSSSADSFRRSLVHFQQAKEWCHLRHGNIERCVTAQQTKKCKQANENTRDSQAQAVVFPKSPSLLLLWSCNKSHVDTRLDAVDSLSLRQCGRRCGDGDRIRKASRARDYWMYVYWGLIYGCTILCGLQTRAGSLPTEGNKTSIFPRLLINSEGRIVATLLTLKIKLTISCLLINCLHQKASPSYFIDKSQALGRDK